MHGFLDPNSCVFLTATAKTKRQKHVDEKSIVLFIMKSLLHCKIPHKRVKVECFCCICSSAALPTWHSVSGELVLNFKHGISAWKHIKLVCIFSSLCLWNAGTKGLSTGNASWGQGHFCWITHHRQNLAITILHQQTNQACYFDGQYNKKKAWIGKCEWCWKTELHRNVYCYLKETASLPSFNK